MRRNYPLVGSRVSSFPRQQRFLYSPSIKFNMALFELCAARDIFTGFLRWRGTTQIHDRHNSSTMTVGLLRSFCLFALTMVATTRKGGSRATRGGSRGVPAGNPAVLREISTRNGRGNDCK